VAEINAQVTNFLGGLNNSFPAKDLEPNQFTLFENMRHDADDDIGAAIKRRGYSKLNANEWAEAAATGIRGIHKFYKASDGSEKIVIAGNTDWGVFNGTDTFTDLSLTLTADKDTNFIVYNDLLIGVNGADAPNKYDGSTAGALSGSPPTASVVAEYADHIFMNDITDPNRIYYSAKENPEDWSTANDSGNIQIGKGSDDYITALVPQRSRLLIFKNNAVFALYGRDNDTFRVIEVSGRIGTPTQKTAAVLDDIAVFVHASGSEIGIFTMGPEATAPEIHTLSRNITKLMEEKTRLGWVTAAIALYKREIWIAYTDLGSSENDRCLWMHADFRGWSDWTNMPINAFFTDNKSGTDKLFGVSTVDGFVYVMDSGNQDVSTNITAKVRTKYFDFGRGRARKNLAKIHLTTMFDQSDLYKCTVYENGIAGEQQTLPMKGDQQRTDNAQLYANYTMTPSRSTIASGGYLAVEIQHDTNNEFKLFGIELEASG
jgi:hypothetical protein